MATLGIHKDFLMEFARLERPVQKRVHEVFEKFQEHRHAGLHLEKLEKARDPRIRTIRITQFMRGVVLAPESGDSFLLLKVLPHDDAIAWAVKHRATLNSATQGIELRNDVALERATAGVRAIAADTTKRLFTHVSDKDLTRLGIDADLLPLVRHLSDESHLDALHKILPEQQYDVLAGLAAGMGVDDVWREVVQAQLEQTPPSVPQQVTGVTGDDRSVPVSEKDGLSAAMARAQGRIALISGPDELMEILTRPFDAWRVFLHPSQRKVACRPSYSGPARVTGGPGTGKTVVALHRALHLAQQLPSEAPDKSILLTTFTRDLASDLSRSLELLIPDAELRDKIHVVNIDALANQIVREDRRTSLSVITGQKEITARWARIARRLGIDFTDVFLDQEWRHVILAQDVRSAESYLKASRSGRGTPLGPLKRAQVWRAVEAFTKELRANGEWTFLQICAEAARLLEERGGERRFRHVVVDEAQDLHPAQWRLLRALVTPGADDLFIAGDTHQRIYGNRVSLRSLGIPVTGRSTRLRINYRTTKEILSWSTGLLTGTSVDDMDGGDESLSGYRSAFRGAPPQLVPASSKAEELAGLVAQIGEWVTAGVAPAEIGIAVRFVQLGKDVAQALERSGIGATVLGSSPSGTSDGVRIGTMHRMKGLEFRCVAVAGVNNGIVPMRSAITAEEVDAQQHREDLLSELSLLFVACTRAREALRVSWHGGPSPFLAMVRASSDR
ncbi:UvrD-helicase domain-containing protein [Streptomyces rubradiris]|uniref:DNA 3'-5' helicase n=1 Tax=Streptomyces rubradiris TaxID=285531 RepID=A0ABQ3RCP0_STRRR|nr:UvrD-helicase domain-containing protein [Streptomyces rubradiris]GHG94023.1 DNA helicase [Streptomyces rubradiris]GHI53620.1 DNA helicase [Streptomyces rubradiris]